MDEKEVQLTLFPYTFTDKIFIKPENGSLIVSGDVGFIQEYILNQRRQGQKGAYRVWDYMSLRTDYKGEAPALKDAVYPEGLEALLRH